MRRNAALIPQSGRDYVLIGRRAALTMPFERINAEFLGAMTRLAKSLVKTGGRRREQPA